MLGRQYNTKRWAKLTPGDSLPLIIIFQSFSKNTFTLGRRPTEESVEFPM